MTVASSKPPGSRKSWLRILIPLGVVAGVVIAAGPPVLQAVDQKLRAQEIAEATDPATGVLRIESAPMQCASTCGAKRNEARTICGGYLPEDELRRRNIPAPDSSCDAAMVASYSSCMASCGFTAPNKLRNVPQAEWLPADPPPLGSPDELALRKARP